MPKVDVEGIECLLERVYYVNSCRFKVADVASNDGQTMFQRCRGYEQVCAVVSDSR